MSGGSCPARHSTGPCCRANGRRSSSTATGGVDFFNQKNALLFPPELQFEPQRRPAGHVAPDQERQRQPEPPGRADPHASPAADSPRRPRAACSSPGATWTRPHDGPQPGGRPVERGRRRPTSRRSQQRELIKDLGVLHRRRRCCWPTSGCCSPPASAPTRAASTPTPTSSSGIPKAAGVLPHAEPPRRRQRVQAARRVRRVGQPAPLRAEVHAARLHQQHRRAARSRDQHRQRDRRGRSAAGAAARVRGRASTDRWPAAARRSS